MTTPDLRNEEGQSLIQVALMLVVLIGFVGLALDGGNLYAARRQMQNAADAGALAGAWAICMGNAANAASIAADYMQKNGDVDAGLGNVDIVNTYKVTTRASKPVSPFLPFTFSGSVNVPASASAACGVANKSCGVWPLGMPQSVWDGFDSCTSGKKIALWIKDGKRPGETGAQNPPAAACIVNGTTYNTSTHFCNCYQCKYQNSPIYLQYGETASSYLDFSQIPDIVTGQTSGPGCGTSELVNNIGGTDTIPVTLGQCITAINGVRSNQLVVNAIDTRRNDTIAIPLYDNQTCSGASCNGGVNRHIAEFGCVTVNQSTTNSNQAVMTIPMDPVAGATTTGKNPKALDVAFISVVMFTMNCNNACTTSCGSTDGSPPDLNGVNTSNLVP